MAQEHSNKLRRFITSLITLVLTGHLGTTRLNSIKYRYRLFCHYRRNPSHPIGGVMATSAPSMEMLPQESFEISTVLHFSDAAFLSKAIDFFQIARVSSWNLWL